MDTSCLVEILLLVIMNYLHFLFRILSGYFLQKKKPEYLQAKQAKKALCRIRKNIRIAYDSYLFFSHPDYTVGFGIAPNPAPKRSRTLPPIGNFTLP